jgi:hypothetical protein
MLVLKLKDISFIYYYATHTICFIYKSCTLHKGMVIGILWNKGFFFCYLNTFIFLKRKNVCMIEKMTKNEISILSFGLNFYKILNLKVDICATFRTKHGLNIIHSFTIP